MAGRVRHVLGLLGAASEASASGAKRDRMLFIAMFLLPVCIISIIGVALRGYTLPSYAVGVLDRAGTVQSRALVEAIDAEEFVRVRSYDDESHMRLAVFRGRLNGGILIPADWRGERDLEVYLAMAGAGAPVIRALIDAQLSRAERAPVAVELRLPEGASDGPPRIGFQYTAPANVVLFIMINGFVASIGITQLRRSGLSRRLLATPARTWEIFAMLAIGPLQVMIVQAAFLIAITGLVFDVPWGNPLGITMVTAALVLFGVSLVFFMGTVFRAPEQASALGPLLGIGFGMLGGCMWPLLVVPPLMRTIGHASPAAWAMDAYLALIFGRVGAADVLFETAVLLAFAAGLAGIGILRLRPQFAR